MNIEGNRAVHYDDSVENYRVHSMRGVSLEEGEVDEKPGMTLVKNYMNG